MFKILKKRILAPDTTLMVVEAPRLAKAARPGQFVIVRADEEGERVPLTISDYDPERGTVTIVTQGIGLSTKKINALGEGDSLANMAGPLGHPSEFLNIPIEELRTRKMLFVAGGLGIAPVYPQVKWLHDRGIAADVIIGAKTKELLIMREEISTVAGNLYVATDDGSEGFKGLVTDLIRDLVEKQGKHYDQVVTIGPMIMMKFVARTTKEFGIPAIASLNTLMIDGTGMCGACRVTVGDKTRFACVEGPEFDAHQVDFDEAMRRQTMYRDQEQAALFFKKDEEQGGHACKIGLNSKR